MGISVLAEAQDEMRARWGKGVNPGPKEKDEPKQKENRKMSKPATKANGSREERLPCREVPKNGAYCRG